MVVQFLRKYCDSNSHKCADFGVMGKNVREMRKTGWLGAKDPHRLGWALPAFSDASGQKGFHQLQEISEIAADI